MQALTLARTADDDLRRRSGGRRNRRGLRRELGSRGTLSGGCRQTGCKGSTDDARLELAGDADSSSPYSKDEGGDPPPTKDLLAAKLYRRLQGLDSIGNAGSRWQDASKLAHLSLELWSSEADAHAAMPAWREFAHGWAGKTGTVSDEAIGGLGDEAWRVLAKGYSEEVTYKWRRGNLVLEAHIQCLPACRSDIDKAARAWVDAIDEEARRPSS